jgi:ribosome-associated toxin RatA of RatAB toxin-antitoxin module
MTDASRAAPHDGAHEPYALGPMPYNLRVRTVDELVVHSRLATIFRLALEVERWPEHLAHYRYVRFRSRTSDDGGLVEMSANRPFGLMQWPTRWVSEMAVQRQSARHVDEPRIRFRHVEGVTRGMEVEWSFRPAPGGTRVRIVHAWNGPRWPLIGGVAASVVIAPVFVHGIASRTLAGLARVAEAEPL